jgi:hypothetical protein
VASKYIVFNVFKATLRFCQQQLVKQIVISSIQSDRTLIFSIWPPYRKSLFFRKVAYPQYDVQEKVFWTDIVNIL